MKYKLYIIRYMREAEIQPITLNEDDVPEGATISELVQRAKKIAERENRPVTFLFTTYNWEKDPHKDKFERWVVVEPDSTVEDVVKDVFGRIEN